MHRSAFSPAVAVTLMASTPAIEAAGFAIVEQGVSGLGNAYAGAAAVAADESTLYYNPAGLSRLDGTRLSLGLHALRPRAEFRNQGSLSRFGSALIGSGRSDGGTSALIPNFYFTHRLDPQLSLGLGVTVPFGMSTEYAEGWVGRYHALESHLETLDISPSLAWKMNDRIALGGSLILRYAEAELSNAVDFGSLCIGALANASGEDQASAAAQCAAEIGPPLQADGHQVLKGDDWGLGFSLGALIRMGKRTDLGINYRSMVDLRLAGNVDFSLPDFAANAQTGALLSGLFADTAATSELELPESVALSLAHRPSTAWELLFDVSYTRWSRFDALRVDLVSLPDALDPVTPEEWEDSWRYALGANWRANDGWTLRTGVAYDETPIPDARLRTPRIPGDNRIWAAIGATHSPNARWRFDLGYAHLFIDDPEIDNEDITTGHVLRGRYANSVDILSAAASYRF